jgi:hypothetical protein
MSRTAELPEMVQEFVELSRAYLVQETVEPAKALGRYAGFSFAGAICFAFGSLFLGIAGTRGIVGLMPDGHVMWTGVGYLLSAIALGAVAGLIVKVAQ